MSQQHGGFPPPPTPALAPYSTRRQYGEPPPPINPMPNRALGTRQDSGSPISTPLSPMFSSVSNIHSSTSISGMTARSYNPQQWTQPNLVGGSHMTFSSSSRRSVRESTGMESMMPSPPPPYTPPPDSASRHMRASPSIGGSGFVSSPLSSGSALAGPSQRSSPSHGPAAHFPPPPTSNPGVYRDPQRSKFSLSGLAARVKRSDSSEQVYELGISHVPASPVAPIINPRAPSSRRAASTGAITNINPSMVGRISPESAAWEPGMPLPPPPPGPPPTGNRSQSLNRYPQRAPALHNSSPANNLTFQPARRRHESTLGAIPPTPSDWVPESDIQVPSYPELRINTGRAIQNSASADDPARRSAAKTVDTDSIRARRSRSRAKREGQDSGQQILISGQADHNKVSPNISKPADLILSSAESLLKKRRTATAEGSSSRSSPVQPFSPEQVRRQMQGRHLSLLTPPYTPSTAAPRPIETLPLTGSKGTSEHQGDSESSERPLSHILHAPIEESNIVKPLNPRKVGQESVPTSADVPEFMQSSLIRYGEFIKQEVSARNDRERLELFASFMVYESRLRRNEYSEAFNVMGGEIMELTRDLWRPFPVGRDINSRTSISRKPSSDSVDMDSSFKNSVSSLAELTPATDTESLADEIDPVPERSASNPWGDRFQPCLSPIPSMAVSTVPDEESSRGRSASRWWEESADGSGENEGHRMERTKQETKYMSLHPQDLVIAAEPSPNQNTPTPGTSKQTFRYGVDAYPPEKVGWHEETHEPPSTTPPPLSATLLTPRNKAPMGQSADKAALDVSRLVTLPPSYPRHYPAVINSHPALSALRANHRAVTDLSSIREIVQGHEAAEASRRQAWRNAAMERLQRFRSDMQDSINQGRTSYGDAAQAELVFRQSEAEKVLSQSERQSEEFRHIVADPVCRTLVRNLHDCDKYIAQLTEALDAEALCDQRMLAQTEGDERPELVEQLTLLKWLFESREHIHKGQFDIDAARMTRESGTVLTHYRQAQDDTQVRRIEQRLAVDQQKRQLQYAQQVKKRFDCLQETVERHVSRGVEIQLSVFWDIAPGLTEVVNKVPQDLHGFKIIMPSSEVEENPAYQDFPLQYMFSILNHAKKSAYQFIETQINLLCLLHEVHTATALASTRVTEIQRNMAGERTSEVQAEMVRIREQKERELTQDLKDKVGEVEGQWSEALGSAIESCIERVRMWLQESGGWDQSLEV